MNVEGFHQVWGATIRKLAGSLDEWRIQRCPYGGRLVALLSGAEERARGSRERVLKHRAERLTRSIHEW
jgi:hypothetical protein